MPEVSISLAEYSRRARKALQANGIPFGMSADIANLFAFEQIRSGKGIACLVQYLEVKRGCRPLAPILTHRGELLTIVRGRMTDAEACVLGLDLATARAMKPGRKLGVCLLLDIVATGCLDFFAGHEAEKGFSVAILRRPEGKRDSGGVWIRHLAAPRDPTVLLRQRELTTIVCDSEAADISTLTWDAVERTIESCIRRGKSDDQLPLLAGALMASENSVMIVVGLGEKLSYALDQDKGPGSQESLPLSAQPYSPMRGITHITVDAEKWQKIEREASRMLVAENTEDRLRENGFDARSQF